MIFPLTSDALAATHLVIVGKVSTGPARAGKSNTQNHCDDVSEQGSSRAKAWEIARGAYGDGHSVEKIADLLGVSTSTVCRRAREQGWTRAGRLQEDGVDVPGCDPVAALAGDLLGHLQRLARDIEHRLSSAASREPADTERDVKLVEQILRALERVESLTQEPSGAGSGKSRTAGEPVPAEENHERVARAATLRDALARRFDALRNAGADSGLSGEPERG